MYNQWYNDTVIQRSIGQLRMRVHYRSNYENAVWDGRQMSFGDGRVKFHPLVSLDVVAHEVSHGYTQKTSGLEYRYQSGGMNEAFSDMAGEATEYFLRSKNDWKIGYDIFKATGKALRYMDNPELDSKSISHTSKYYRGMNVHYSSGIYNKAFHLLSNKPSWGIKKAFEVFLKANEVYWSQRSTFNQGACGVIKAAKNAKYSTDDVACAFKEVGVQCSSEKFCSTGGMTTPAPPPPTPSPPPGCSGRRVSYYRSMTSSSWYHYYRTIPANACHLVVYLRPRSGQYAGNADLYARHGGLKPTTTSYDFKSTRNDSLDQISIPFPKAGKWYFSLRAVKSFRSVYMYVSYNIPVPTTPPPPTTPPGPANCSGRVVNTMRKNLRGRAPSCYVYSISIPTHTCHLVSTLAPQNPRYAGNANMYISYGTRPTECRFDYKSDKNGSAEMIEINNPKPGTWYIGICANTSYSYLNWYGSYKVNVPPTLPPPTVPSRPSSCVGRTWTKSLSLYGTKGRCYSYPWTVQPNACHLTARLTPSSYLFRGQADMYMKHGSRPTNTSYDYKSERADSNELIHIATPKSGTWYITLCYKEYTRYLRFRGSFTAQIPPTLPPPTVPSRPATCSGRTRYTRTSYLYGSTGRCYRYSVNVRQGMCHVYVKTMPYSTSYAGNVDMFIKFGGIPSRSNYDKRSVRSDSKELIYLGQPKVGRWWVLLCATQTYRYLRLQTYWTEPIPTTTPAPTTPVPPTIPAPPQGCNGVAKTTSSSYLHGTQKRCYHYEWEIKANTCQAVVQLKPLYTRYAGDAQLYMKYGSQASNSIYDAKSTRPGSHEMIVLTNPRAGTWFIAICVHRYYRYLRLHGQVISSSNNTQCKDTQRERKGIPVLSTSTGYWRHYQCQVKPGTCTAQFQLRPRITGYAGDGDLFVRYGAKPSLTVSDYKSTNVSSSYENITISKPKAGKWYVSVYARTRHSYLYITGNYDVEKSSRVCSLGHVQRIRKSDISGGARECKHYSWYVRSSACNLQLKLFPGTSGRGNADLYMRYNTKPSTTSYDYMSKGSTSTEEINIKSPRSGIWHFAICGTTSYFNLQYLGIYNSFVSSIDAQGVSGNNEQAIKVINQEAIYGGEEPMASKLNSEGRGQGNGLTAGGDFNNGEFKEISDTATDIDVGDTPQEVDTDEQTSVGEFVAISDQTGLEDDTDFDLENGGSLEDAEAEISDDNDVLQEYSDENGMNEVDDEPNVDAEGGVAMATEDEDENNEGLEVDQNGAVDDRSELHDVDPKGDFLGPIDESDEKLDD